MRPHDLPSAERFEHGTRSRYVCGCRCDECKRANREYARTRAKAVIFHGKNELVSAKSARRHLLRLSAMNVGRRAVADACDVGKTTLQQIRSGKKVQIRAYTEKRILSVSKTAVSNHAIVPANRTWLMINHLLHEGFNKAELARRLGYATPAIQIRRDFVLAETQARVERFYRVVMAGAEGLPGRKPKQEAYA